MTTRPLILFAAVLLSQTVHSQPVDPDSMVAQQRTDFLDVRIEDGRCYAQTLYVNPNGDYTTLIVSQGSQFFVFNRTGAPLDVVVYTGPTTDAIVGPDAVRLGASGSVARLTLSADSTDHALSIRCRTSVDPDGTSSWVEATPLVYSPASTPREHIGSGPFILSIRDTVPPSSTVPIPSGTGGMRPRPAGEQPVEMPPPVRPQDSDRQ